MSTVEKVPVPTKGIHLDLPDGGEDQVTVVLHLPDGRKVELGYNAFYGSLDVCMYEPAEGVAGEMFKGYASKECFVTNWTDKKDKDGKYVSSMHDAPQAESGREHQRMATQLVISVGENQDK